MIKINVMKKSKTIIDKIKEENIKQKPKWHFTLLNILNWSFYIICILIGAASFSVILFSISQTDFNLISHISHSRVEMFLGLLPFFWIVTLLIFLFVAVIVFRRLKNGYKFNWLRLLTASTAASGILGTIFFIGGGSLHLENAFSEKVNVYKSVNQHKKEIWMNPEEGFLSGTIEEISKDKIRFIDFNNKIWDIDFSHASIAGRVQLREGEQVKLIGEITSPNNFHVKEVRPWNGKGKQRKRNKSNKEN